MCANISISSPASATPASRKGTAPEPARSACSVTRCASISRRAFRWSPPRSCTSNPSSMSCCGSCKARPMSAICNEHGVTIWDEWADAKGELGPIYGRQWRSWPTPDGRHIDQISARRRRAEARSQLAPPCGERLECRRARSMALPPCHCLFQFYVAEGRLSCQLYQRSADVFLGVPFNIASYALAHSDGGAGDGPEAGRVRPQFRRRASLLTHLDQADEQLKREPRALPRMEINPEVTSLFDFVYEDFKLMGYDPHPAHSVPRWRCDACRGGKGGPDHRPRRGHGRERRHRHRRRSRPGGSAATSASSAK